MIDMLRSRRTLRSLREENAMGPPRLGGYRLAFLLGVPLAWAVLLWFHPAPDVDDIYGTLQDHVTRWIIVHLGTLLFIGLIGAALYLLVRDLPGPAATFSRVAAAGMFVLFYRAGKAILGVAVGVLVQHTTRPAEAIATALPMPYKRSGTASSRATCS
jgi:hypothetical protein